MRSFCKIVVEQTNGRWAAWFNDVPEIHITGDGPMGAIEQLLDSFGVDQFDSDRMFPIEYAASDWHREFLIALRHCRRIPIQSAR